MTKALDALDRKVLHELDRNARISASELARKLRQGRDRVEYRLDRLVDQGVIRSFMATINLYRLGLTIYKTYFRLRNERKRIKELLTYLLQRPNVYRIAVYDGSWDLNVATVARNPREFYEAHRELVTKFHDIVLEYVMYTIIDVWRFPKAYFTGKAGPGTLTGGEPLRLKLDALDYRILKLLASEARATFADMSERLESNPGTIKYRVSQLESQGIIAGYRIGVDYEKLDMLHFKTQLFPANYQDRFMKRIFQFSEKNPNITYFISQLGECPLELELEVGSLRQFHDIIDDLREEFSLDLQNLRTMVIRDEYFKFVPQEYALNVQE